MGRAARVTRPPHASRITAAPWSACTPGQPGLRIIWLKTCWSLVRGANREPCGGDTTLECHSLANWRPRGVGRRKRRPVLKVPPAE
eukprot:scaffold4853_cov105-Isochrysis_galbana.AAC.7